MKALVLLANGFEEVEGLTQVDFLRRGGIQVTAASIHGEKKVVGAHNITVEADELLSNLNSDEYDIVVLPGGMGGMNNLGGSKEVVALIKKFNEAGKWVAAICASPSVLGDNGLVEGKKCTCYPGFEGRLKGGKTSTDEVVVDGNIITSRGPATSIAFALKMIELLKDKATAEEVGKDTLYLK
ncbi:4-methyl-5(B-hydroxyethyl)-thiazole monophosphate biosynthesis enzyme [Anaerovibrio sp. JC8]|uniref:DJ-1 family glyoxalase III n=1 Tax=Anaerovibrio sp. JC8 TaxID=1240085 RepID=UPI000A09C3F9|nr:DJ-1 family glyoxalase III [Anaerovibrio sp. JC8]ORT99758.1 4-methyl-5(B-hydroxyethyl)-thiazole monophosphate biosynthesis enzyme [Anaerovibrio sp. JC8]